MIPRLQTLVLALTLALCLVKAAASPIEGTWVGTRHGIKAATLVIVSEDGILTGSLTLYIVADNLDGSRNGQALPAERLAGVQWDGRTLRFAIAAADGGAPIPCRMDLTGEGAAVLRAGNAGHPYENIPMRLGN